MVEYVDAFLFATVLRESGTDGRGGAALDDDVAGVGVLDPVRPMVVSELRQSAKTTSPVTYQPRHSLLHHSFPRVLVATAQTCLGNVFSSSHRRAPASCRLGCAAASMSGSLPTSKGWETRMRPVEASLRGSPGCVLDSEVVRQGVQNVALAAKKKKERVSKENEMRKCCREALDDVVVIARAAAGLSQTDGNLASVSDALFGKHMPHESFATSTLAPHA